jgi:sensor histidine kinase regulating citrate/malate metabolism
MTRSKSEAKSQVVPLAVILALATLVIGGYACWRTTDMLTQASVEKAQALTCTLGAVLGDPFAMGEYDHMQHILDAARQNDTDLAYAIVVTTDGKAVATTDPTLKDLNLNRNDFETAALKATDFLQRVAPTPNTFETSIPIKTVGGNAGVLRVGTSTERIQDTVRQLALIMLVICVCTMIISVIVFTGMTKASAAKS